MIRDEKIKKIVKDLLRMSAGISKLNGDEELFLAKTDEDKRKSLDRYADARLGYGARGTAIKFVTKTIKDELKKLSDEELLMVTNIIGKEWVAAFAEELGTTNKKQARVCNLAEILSESVVDRSLRSDKCEEMVKSMNSEALDMITLYAGMVESAMEAVEGIDVEHVADLETGDVKEVVNIRSVYSKYGIFLEETEKIRQQRSL